MTVLFSSNSQVELLGFIFRHCAVAFRRPKIIADQNGVSTPRAVRESLDVLLDALLGVPSVWSIDFHIDLMLGVDLTLCHRISLLQRN